MIRECGLRSVLSELGWQIQDHGVVTSTHGLMVVVGNIELVVPTHDDPPSQIKNGYAGTASVCADPKDATVGQMNKVIAETIEKAANAGSFHLLLGGDHSVGAGTVAGILEARCAFDRSKA